MCSQCSFQVVLRSLRSKQAKHSHHAGRYTRRRSEGRSFSTSLAPTTSSAAIILPPSKPASFTLPSLRFLSQSYSIWNTLQPPPPVPIPQEILADKPFTSHDEAARLLYSLASHPSALSDIDNVVCPTVAGLLSIHHYAGARAVLERVLHEIIHYPAHHLPMGRQALNKIISSLLGTDEYRRLPEWELHSLPAMRSMLFLIMQYLIRYPDKFSLSPQHVKNLVCVPEYLDLQSMPLFLQLFDKVVKDHPHGPSLGHTIPTLHNIMRVYALHGDSQAAAKWMSVISEVIDASHIREETQPAPLIEDEKPLEQIKLSKTSSHRASRSRRQTSLASSAELLGTTYISSLAHLLDEDGKPVSTIDSQAAMKVFQELWRPAGTQEDSSSKPGLSNAVVNLDIFTWSALLHAAALDLREISSERLLELIHTLEGHPSLPTPNTVAYTAVLGGLNRRGDYHLARQFFENEVLPKASLQAKQDASGNRMEKRAAESIVIDAQLLQAAMYTWAGLGDIEMAVGIVKWFGRRNDQDATVEHSEALSPSFEAEASYTAASQANFPECLRGTVKVDTLLVNHLMTDLAKMNRFNSVYNLFNSMTKSYNVYPDSVTLAILAKTALSSAKMRKKGLVPDHAEDMWRSDDTISFQKAGRKVFFSQDGERTRQGLPHGSEVMETGIWDGIEPVKRVMAMYWCMLEENFDAAHGIAVQDSMQVASKGFFSFGKTEDSVEEIDATEAPTPVERYHFTSGLEGTRSPEDHLYRWPSLYPTLVNMHMLVILSAYFGRGSDIPLILSHMKALDMIPMQKTLCLALWAFEETGVYAQEMKTFRTWLVDWLGDVPDDRMVGEFRARQWGGRG